MFTVGYQKIDEDLTIFLDEQLGSGAFGAVFKGSYRGDPCAIKLLYHIAMEMQTNILATKSEVAIAMQLIVRVIFSSRSSTQTLFSFC